MKTDKYVDAVNKLVFSDDLAARVRAADRIKPRFRFVRAAVLAAMLVCFMITTALGAISLLREHPAQTEVIGTDTQNLTDAGYMTFAVTQTIEGVQKHYLELAVRGQYHFRHGMLRNGRNNYQRITGDYLLEPVQMERVNLTLKKNDRTYTLDFDYMDTESGILTNHRSVYHRNENGEILLNATDGNSGQWPVYFHIDTQTITDALPEWSAADFEGCVGGAFALKGGMLISTIINDGLPDARNILYWIAPGAEEAKIIENLDSGNWYVENDTIYYQNDAGQLFGMDDAFQLQLICEYETMDYLQDGLLTVSVRGSLGILDAYTGDLYVFDEIKVTKADTADYHAIRYGSTGTIALVRTQWRHDPERTVLCSLGMLNEQDSELNLLQIENDYDGRQVNWLDEYRLAVIYKSGVRQFLCVYEFDE